MFCPVCGDEFPSSTAQLRFERHVNRCLDGVPDTEPLTPAPAPVRVPSATAASGAPEQHSGVHQPPSGMSLDSVTTPTTTNEGSGESVTNQLSTVDSSVDYYFAIEENRDLILQICPELPPALVEEVLMANGNAVEVALEMLLDAAARDHEPSLGYTSHQYAQPDDEHNGQATHTNHHINKHQRVRRTSSPSSLPAPQCSPVEVVVYDLQPNSTVAKKVGLGVYHTGVVVYDYEFSFGGSRNLKKDSGRSGIWATRSLYTTSAIVKKRFVVGVTYTTVKEIQAKLKEWGKATEGGWRVDDYHLLAKNCNHFAEAFLMWLAEKSVLLVAPTTRSTSPKTPASPATITTTTTPLSGSATTGRSTTAKRTSAFDTAVPPPTTPIINVPAGATPIPSSLMKSSSPLPSSPALPQHQQVRTTAASSPLPLPKASEPTFPLERSQLEEVREAFRLPSWVNRAATVGNAVLPDFLFKKIVEALMPPVPEDDVPSTPQ